MCQIRLPISALLLILLVACSIVSISAEPTTQVSTATLDTIIQSTPTEMEPPPTPMADLDVFQERLLHAIHDEDYATMEMLMGNAFGVGYWLSEGGIISTGDALALLRDDLLSGPNPVSFELDVAPSSVINDDITHYGSEITRAVFSTGWGHDGTDQAILLISTDPSGAYCWSGVLYARDGFIDIEVAAEPGGEPAATETLLPATTRPIFGEVILESTFSSGWPTFDVDNGTTSLGPDGYQMEVVGQALWVYTGILDLSAFYAELVATPRNCPLGQANYGLMFHRRGQTDYRAFVVWCSGMYSLFQREAASSVVMLSEGPLPGSIDPSSGTHTLAIRAIDNTIGLYIDNYLIANARVLDMPAGDIGPYAETMGGPLSVVFNRLAVYQPE